MEGDRLTEKASVTEGSTERRLSILIVSDVRFFREALAEILGRDQAFWIFTVSASVNHSLNLALERRPDIVLFDAAFPNGTGAVRRICNVAPGVRVVVLAIAETEENIITWAEAGAAGYVPATTALADLNSLLAAIMRGEQHCSGHVVAGLLRRIAKGAYSRNARSDAPFPTRLTARELQIVRLVADGLSNKHIARQLKIGVGTTKSHVHNLLGKLGLQRRSQVTRWIGEHDLRLDPAPRPKLQSGAGPGEIVSSLAIMAAPWATVLADFA
jgi:two-component system nitrate/nitrite response regulator NarL